MLHLASGLPNCKNAEKQVNRLQKLLEGANIKLAAVETFVLGKSGRDMLQAVIGGEQEAEVLAALARRSTAHQAP